MLGKKLYLRVQDIYPNNAKPVVDEDARLKEIIVEISEKRLGAAAVVNSNDKVSGIITDGDIRRMLEHGENLNTITAKEISSSSPKTIEPEALAVDALDMLRKNELSQLIVEKDGKYLGMLHLHDLVREGIV
jgi:arabinose-5-phosphate isomerase